MTEAEVRLSELNMLDAWSTDNMPFLLWRVREHINERKLELAKEQPSIKENPNLCWL